MDAASPPASGLPGPRASSAPVLAVVVVDDDAPALEAVLTGLASQDHARTDVLVVDVRAVEDPPAEGPPGEGRSLVDRVGRIVPASLVVRAPGADGEGAAVAAGLRARAAAQPPLREPRFLLFVPGQVVLGDTAVRRLVERALEANAAVVGPKVVGPTGALEETGWWFDGLATPVPVVPVAEVDQGQHDTDRQPDAVAGAAWMARADLFDEIGGIDPGGPDGTGHLGFCRRARAAGASMAVVPAAVARRVGVPVADRHPPEVVRPRFRLREALASTPARMAWLLPVLAVGTVAGVVHGVSTGRFRHVRGLVAAWPWNLRRLGSARRRPAGHLPGGAASTDDQPGLGRRTSPTSDLRRVVTGRDLVGEDGSEVLRRLNGAFGSVFGPGGLAMIIAAVVLGFGSRSLVADGMPVVGRLQRLPEVPGDLVAAWWAGWRSTGMGTTGSGPDGLALIGLLVGWWPGSAGSAWTVLVLGAFAVGAVGMWRLVRPVGGGRSRAVAVLVYLAVPIPYDALRGGRLAPLAAFAVMPWVARRLAGAQAMAPYGIRGGEPGPGTRLRGLWADVLVTALMVVAVVAIDPVLVVPVALVAVGLVVGTVLSGSSDGLGRLAVVVGCGSALAALVHLPVALAVAGATGGGWWNWWGGVSDGGWGDTGSIGLSGVISLTTTGDGSVASVALFVLPVLALWSARGRHLSVVVRAWFVAVAGAGVLVAVDQGWLGGSGILRSLDPAVLLVPVALGLAWASAAGVAGLGADLAHLAGQVQVGRGVRLVRNGLLGVVVAGLTVGALPVLAGSFAGDWGVPRHDLASAIPGIGPRLGDRDVAPGGDARVLWIGDPLVLPAVGVPLVEADDRVGTLGGLALAVTDGRPDLSDQWAPGTTDGLSSLRDSLAGAIDGATHRLGAELGRWGVARVVVVERSAPVPGPAVVRPVPDRLTEVLARQLDLQRVEAVNRAVTMYRNTAVEAPYSVVRDRNRRVVPATVARLTLTRWAVKAPADGALRWMVGPDDRWEVRVDDRQARVLAAGQDHGVADRPSVRVATGSVADFEVDDLLVGRRWLQLVSVGALVLLASWARTSRDAARRRPGERPGEVTQ